MILTGFTAANIAILILMWQETNREPFSKSTVSLDIFARALSFVMQSEYCRQASIYYQLQRNNFCQKHCVPSSFEDGNILKPFLSGKKEGKEVCLVQIPIG